MLSLSFHSGFCRSCINLPAWSNYYRKKKEKDKKRIKKTKEKKRKEKNKEKERIKKRKE
jgi:hypothetical protein